MGGGIGGKKNEKSVGWAPLPSQDFAGAGSPGYELHWWKGLGKKEWKAKAFRYTT